jgi:hypothetical protein
MSSNLMRVNFKELAQGIIDQFKGAKLAKKSRDMAVEESGTPSKTDQATVAYQQALVSIKEIIKKLSIYKKYVPVILISIILIIGLIIGQRIASLSNEPLSIPKPAPLPTTTTLTPDSDLAPLQQSINQFNPQLPDLVMPALDDKISLQDLEE